MYFIANKAALGSLFQTVHGPFETEAAAQGVLKQIMVPGDYVVYGPADPVKAVRITAPAMSDLPLT